MTANTLLNPAKELVEKTMIVSSYLRDVFDTRRFPQRIDQAAKSIKQWEKTNEFDSIAFTGISGAALAFPLSVKLGKPLLCVRKPGSNTHSKHDVEGNYATKRFIIVDDFCDSGETIARIIDTIYDEVGEAQRRVDIKCVGIYLYAGAWLQSKFNLINLIERI